jgi:multidrug resistance efflux pump
VGGELGQIVGPTTTVFEIATIDAARVTAEVDERYVRALRVGMPAQVLAVGSEDPPQAATISYVAQALARAETFLRFASDNVAVP